MSQYISRDTYLTCSDYNQFESALQLPSGGEYRQSHLEDSDGKKKRL